MKKDLSEIVLILDESGSMSFCKSDTVGGFNKFLTSQQKIKGEANVTFVKFSDYYKIINDATPINHVSHLNESNYTPSNSTALLDAVGKTINSIGKRLANTPENQRPEKVIMVIITDGYENNSKEFSRKQIFDMVTHQREKYNWEFIFLGANIDAWGQEIGIFNNVNISKDDLNRSFKGMSYYTANYRSGNVASTTDFNLSSAQLDEELEKMSEEK
jgi:von Willebrand factor type A domain